MHVVVKIVTFWCVGCVLVTGAYLQKFEDDFCDLEPGESGICRNIHNCPYAKVLLKENKYPDICSFVGTTPIVCCKNITSSIRALLPGTLSEKKCEEYYPDIKYLLVGAAKPAAPQEFSHMAVIGFGEESDIMWLCGGSLISKTFILTAAHCLKSRDFGSAKWARLGDLDLATDTDKAEPQQFTIKRGIPHPDYKRPARYHDIALIELDREVKINPFVNVACLDTNREHNESSMIATGWGKIEFSGPFSSFLLKSDLDTVPFEVCEPYYKEVGAALPEGVLDEYQICAGGGSQQDTCQGDSGGPLQVKNSAKYSSKKVYNIVGITSFGKACGLTGSPGIYTRVYSYLPWIENIVWPSP